MFVVSVGLLIVCGFGLAGCSSQKIELDKNSTIRYDSKVDGVPKAMGGASGGKKLPPSQ